LEYNYEKNNILQSTPKNFSFFFATLVSAFFSIAQLDLWTFFKMIVSCLRLFLLFLTKSSSCELKSFAPDFFQGSYIYVYNLSIIFLLATTMNFCYAPMSYLRASPTYFVSIKFESCFNQKAYRLKYAIFCTTHCEKSKLFFSMIIISVRFANYLRNIVKLLLCVKVCVIFIAS